MTTERTTHQAIGSGMRENLPAGAVVALLHQTHRMIARAGQTITAQKARIAALENMATTDELTGLKNVRGFTDFFARELDLCHRGLSRGGILLSIELDNFEAIRKRHGATAAKAGLRLVARTLGEGIRVMDVAGRLGSDEFVLLLSHTTRCDAADRAQKLAWQLNKLVLAWHGEEIPVQVSLGLRNYGAGDRIEQFFGRHMMLPDKEHPMNA